MSPGIVVARAPRERILTAAGAWEMTWHDEFDAPALDLSKWDFDLGNGFQDTAHDVWVPGWGNEELQSYTRDSANLRIEGGALRIRALRAPRPTADGCAFTSARIKTRRRDGQALFAQCFGRFEFRARVPWGKGLWPALWLLPQQDRYGGWAASGEIDVMEIVGERPHEVLSSLHYGSSYPARTLHTHVHPLPGGSTVADWHVYAVEWEPGEIRFFVDEVLTCTRRFWWSCSQQRDGQGVAAARLADLNPWPAPFDQPFHIVMNVAVGGNFPGAPNESTPFPAEMAVDYVRVYRKVGGYGPVAPRSRGRFPWHKPR